MMRRLISLNLPLLLLMAFVTFMATSCKKDNPSPTLASTEIKLLNGGTEYGTLTIRENSDGSASANINLASAYRVEGATLTASIITVVTGTEAGLYASLTSVNGGTGISTTNPVKDANTNASIPYSTLVSKSGYIVRIMLTPSVVYASAIL